MADGITVVGAGLVGSLLSIYLARRGHDVAVLERRADMRRETISAGRSINLAISARGLHALAQVGLEAPALAHAVPMRGRMMHSLRGELSYQPYGKSDSECIHALSRGWLNMALLDAAEATGRVRVEFRRRLSAIDLDGGRIEVRDEATGESAWRDAPRVIGTDGYASAIRSAMVERGLAEVSQVAEAHGYKELVIPADVARAAGMERNALHIWPRGAYMLIALPNLDGSWTCTLFLPWEGERSFGAIADEAALLAFFGAEFPDAVPLMPTLVRDYFENPTGQMVTVKTSRWNAAGRALLLGDAAHAIVPFFGQGMNCGFEDCVELDAMLGTGASWDDAFERLGRERKPNSDAIADMAVENFVEMRDRVADPAFLLEKAVERALQRQFPDVFVSRYAYVSFTRAPYRFAWDVGRVQSGILAELCRGLTSADAVDLELARALIDARLRPLVAAR